MIDTNELVARLMNMRIALTQCRLELIALHHGNYDMEHAEKHSAGLRMANVALANQRAPVGEDATMRSALAGIADDYMTSEQHHPGYVLIPTAKFEELRALGSAPVGQDETGVREALAWYGEQSRLARLIHSEGDSGRHALAGDGGKRANATLASKSAAIGVGEALKMLAVEMSGNELCDAADAEALNRVCARLANLAISTAPATRPGDEVTEAFKDAALARDEAGFAGTPAQCIQFLAAEVARLQNKEETK